MKVSQISDIIWLRYLQSKKIDWCDGGGDGGGWFNINCLIFQIKMILATVQSSHYLLLHLLLRKNIVF